MPASMVASACRGSAGWEGRSWSLANCSSLAYNVRIMLNASQRWRKHARHARIMTDRVRGPSAKVAMMKLAVSYEMIAVRAEQRELAEKLARYKDY